MERMHPKCSRVSGVMFMYVQTYRDLHRIKAVSTQVPRHLEYPLRLRPPSMGDSKESPLVRARKELARAAPPWPPPGRGLPVDQAAAKKAQHAMQPSRPPPGAAGHAPEGAPEREVKTRPKNNSRGLGTGLEKRAQITLCDTFLVGF